MPAGLYLRSPNQPLSAADPPLQVANYTALQAQDYHDNNFNCSASETPGFCHIQGQPQDLSAQCLSLPECSGFVFQPQTKSANASGWLKTGPINSSCTSIAPFLTTYSLNYRPVAAPTSPSSGHNTGAIAAGVVVGVVVVTALAAGAALLIRRRRNRAKLYRGVAPHSGTAAATIPPRGNAPEGWDVQSFPTSYPTATDSSSGATSVANASRLRRLLDARHGSSATELTRSLSVSEGLLGQSTSGPDTAQPDAGTLIMAKMRGRFEAHGHPRQLWGIRPEEIQITKRPDGSDWVLGSGGFASVYKATMNHGLDTVAVKVLRGKQDERSAKAFVKEMAILSSSLHPQILQYLGSCTVDGLTCLVTEYLEGGDLWNALSKDETYSWHARGKIVALDIGRALSYLHNRQPKVVHQDIKSSNCLITADGRAKLADVGLARLLANTATTTKPQNFMGTWAWAAPEKILGAPADERADIFSFGTLLHEICTSEVPDRGRLRPVKPEEGPEELVDLLWLCLSAEPAARPTARECVEVIAALQ